MSPAKSDKIYNAVADRMMNLRVHIAKNQPTGDALDFCLAEAMDKIATAAVKAYETPLKPSTP